MIPLDDLIQKSNPNSIPAAKKLSEKMGIQHVTNIRETARQMYPNSPYDRFDYFVRTAKVDDLTGEAKDAYWKAFATLHPEGEQGASKHYMSVLERELAVYPTLVQKEAILRDRLASAPAWAAGRVNNALGAVSAVNANANVAKTAYTYTKNLKGRIESLLSTKFLDPDVSTDDHIEDFLQIEQAGLLEHADVVDGRLAAIVDGKTTPAFKLASSPVGSVAPNEVEQAIVRTLAFPEIRKSVEGNIFASRQQAGREESQIGVESRRLLETGEYEMPRWADLFAMQPTADPAKLIESGLRGEIAAGRIRTDKDLARAVYAASLMYPQGVTNAPAE